MHMSLKIQPLEPIPEDTARVARLAFPKGTVATKLRDAFQQLYQDESFQTLYSRRGPPAFSPWRLALVTVLQFMAHLSDCQAADAVRGTYLLDIRAGPGIDGSRLPLQWTVRISQSLGGQQRTRAAARLDVGAVSRRTACQGARKATNRLGPCLGCGARNSFDRTDRRNAASRIERPRHRRAGLVAGRGSASLVRALLMAD